MQDSQPALRTLTSDPSQTLQLIVDPPASGSWNMAVDEALLAAAAEEGTATLRLYQWSEPTLSLGYFQRYEDRRQHAASLESSVVRRSSGGGAILHDHELTYSLALPSRLVPDPHQLYLHVHRAFMAILTRLACGAGSDWSLRLCEEDEHAAAGNEPFLCFERRSCGDVLLAGAHAGASNASPAPSWKIVGSAQRRRRGAILQHGSLLLEHSAAAPELPGFADITGQIVSIDALLAAFPGDVGAVLGVQLSEADFPNAIRAVAEEFERSKYDAESWTRHR